MRVHGVDQLSANEEQLLNLKQILPIVVRRFGGRMPEGCLFGMMLTPEENFLVINLNGKWLRLKRGLSVMHVLTELAGEKLARKLLRKMNKAIVLVRNATSYDEVASLHDPIKLDLKL